jgi:hypothetical protein
MDNADVDSKGPLLWVMLVVLAEQSIRRKHEPTLLDGCETCEAAGVRSGAAMANLYNGNDRVRLNDEVNLESTYANVSRNHAEAECLKMRGCKSLCNSTLLDGHVDRLATLA